MQGWRDRIPSVSYTHLTASIDAVVAHRGAKLAGTGYPAVIGKLTLADTTKWKDILQQPTRLGFRVTKDVYKRQLLSQGFPGFSYT